MTFIVAKCLSAHFRRSVFTGSASTSTGSSIRKERSLNWSSAIPRSLCLFALSNRGYGFLWNMLGIGRAELGANGTKWVADAAGRSIIGSPRRRAPARDRQPKLRGRLATAETARMGGRVLAVQAALPDSGRAARGGPGVQRRGLPLSVMVVDFFHWTRRASGSSTPPNGPTRRPWWTN